MRSTRLFAVLTALALLVPTGLADWPQFRHDDTHSGAADQAGAIQAPFQPWAFDADGPIVSSPAVTTVDGETRTIVGSYPGQSTPGTVYALDEDGQTVWSTTPTGSTGGYIASPTVEDLDDDGTKEVVVPSLDDSTLRVFDATDGTQEWSTQVGSSNEDLLASSPIVADLDDSEGKEIALGGSTSDQSGSLLVYDADGTQLQAVELDGPAWSTPLYEDLDDDGAKELYLATGVPDTLSQLFPSAKTGGQSLYAFEFASGAWSVDWQTQLSGPALSSPTAEDLDQDGSPEIALGAQGGHFYAIEPSDGTIQADHTANVGPLVAISSPAIADVDADGMLEVAVGVYNGIQALELTSTGFVGDGKISLPQVDGQDPWVAASPAVADVDADGSTDLLASTVPINVTDEIVNSDALPGVAFAVDGSTLADTDTQPLWSFQMPDDGGISGPTVADVDADGRSEVLAGEGLPIIGNGSALHLLDAANPVVEEISLTPEDPTTQDEISFDARATDENTPGDELTYAWDFGDGATSTDEAPTHSYADDGDYTVSVDVTDPEGHTWTQTQTVSVANVPPDVSADVATDPGSLEAVFDGTVDDPDGQTESVTWDLGDGTTVASADTTHTYDTGGTYEAELTAVDDDGDAASVTKTVHVNRFPALSGDESASIAEGHQLSLALTADDPDGDAIEVVDVTGAESAGAEVTGPSEVTLNWTPSYDVTTRDASPASVTLNVSIQDDGRPTGTDSHEVTVGVENTNRAPQVGAPSPTTASVGATTVIEGTLNDPDGNPVTLTASGLPDYTSLTETDTGYEIAVFPPEDVEPAQHEVTLAADDGLDQAELTFTLDVVPNQPPTPSVEGPDVVEPDTLWDPNPVDYEGQASDPEGDDIARWTWTVENRLTHGDSITHRFAEHGTYDIGLEAEDTKGGVGATTYTVMVDDALTGDVVVHQVSDRPDADRLVVGQVVYDDGTPLADHAVNLTVTNEEMGQTTREETLTTASDGTFRVRLDGELGLPVFLPGQHTVTLTAEADSLPGAAVQDVESVAMETTFPVRLPAP